MWIKKYSPYTPSRRFMTGYTFEEITRKRPEKSLVKFLWAKWWRNNQGRITTRFRWWGHKKLYRIVDFKGYDKLDIPWRVDSIEYDPYRSARIALVVYKDGEKRYVLAWNGAKVWDKIQAGVSSPLTPGNRKQLKDIPEGFSVHNLEFTPFTKWKILKSAWCYGVITWKSQDEWRVFVKLSSWEVRKFDEKCYATLWVVSNEDHKNIVIGKAWRKRWMWYKWKVRGKAMNPVDHPHWGWEGGTDIALKYPKSFTGKPVPPFKKTRKKKKWSDKFIVVRRNKR